MTHDLFKKEALRLLGPNYGKSDIEEAVRLAGMTCKIRGFSAKTKPNASVYVYTDSEGKGILINFARWAYQKWPVSGRFWISVFGKGVKGFHLYLESSVDRTTILVNNQNGPECRWLEGIAQAGNPRLEPCGRILLWEIVECDLILKVECLQTLRPETLPVFL